MTRVWRENSIVGFAPVRLGLISAESLGGKPFGDVCAAGPC